MPVCGKTIGCSRFVYNQTLAARKGAYASGSSIHMTFKESHSGYDCVKLLPGLKDTYPWLREVDSTALQASVLQAHRNLPKRLRRGCKTSVFCG